MDYESLIEELSQKHNYNEDLKKVLPKVLDIFVKHHGEQSKNEIIEVLENCPIYVEDQFSNEDKSEQYYKDLLKGRNSHIVDKENDERGVYGKNQGGTSTAYYSQPVFDENGKIVDKVNFIVVDQISEYNTKYQEIFGTNINIPHLFHELKHAYCAKNEEYIQKDNQYFHRVGLARELYSITPSSEGKYEVEMKKSSGVILEESINSIDENEMACKYLGCNQDYLDSLYRDNIMIPSSYNTLVKKTGEVLYDLMGKSKVEDLRVNNNLSHIKEFNDVTKEGNQWKESEQGKNGKLPWTEFEDSTKEMYEVIGDRLKYYSKGLETYKEVLTSKWSRVVNVLTGYREGKDMIKEQSKNMSKNDNVKVTNKNEEPNR